MKPFIIFLFSLFLIFGCEKSEPRTEEQIKQKEQIELVNKFSVNSWGVKEVEHEGCQYIVFANGDRGGITHKGNCNNPIHKVENNGK